VPKSVDPGHRPVFGYFSRGGLKKEMRSKFAAVIVAGAAMAAGIAFSAAPAVASPSATFTVTPGGAYTATSTAVTFKDGSVTMNCTGSTAKGTLKSGSGLAGAGIGSISSLAYTGCTGPLGTVTVTPGALPYSINAVSYASGVTQGNIGPVSVKVVMTGCSFTVTGSAPGNFNNSTSSLNLTAGSGLSVSGVSGCLGLVKNGDHPTYVASYKTSPTEKITSP
jgi:hypothetical protein